VRKRAFQVLERIIEDSYGKTAEILDYIASRLETEIPPEHLETVRPLNWEEVREMSSRGIEFGSHTVTHPILSKLAPDDLYFELGMSKRTIEERTGRPVTAVSYPNGKPNAFNEDTFRRAAELGYRFGVTYLPGVNPRDGMERFRIRRIAVEYECSASWFRGSVLIPRMFQS
jgi:hypothetical protein